MDPFEFLLTLALILAPVLLISQYLRGRSHGSRPDEGATALRDEVRQLRERVGVLERVITDNRASLDLDREIERLRDRQGGVR